MKKIYWFLGCSFLMVFGLAFFLTGCGDSGSGGGESPCGGSYPLWCFRVNACCPTDYPYYCDGQCLQSPGTGCVTSDTCRQYVSKNTNDLPQALGYLAGYKSPGSLDQVRVQ